MLAAGDRLRSELTCLGVKCDHVVAGVPHPGQDVCRATVGRDNTTRAFNTDRLVSRVRIKGFAADHSEWCCAVGLSRYRNSIRGREDGLLCDAVADQDGREHEAHYRENESHYLSFRVAQDESR